MNTENNNGLLIKARGLKKHYRRGIETIKASRVDLNRPEKWFYSGLPAQANDG